MFKRAEKHSQIYPSLVVTKNIHLYIAKFLSLRTFLSSLDNVFVFLVGFHDSTILEC